MPWSNINPTLSESMNYVDDSGGVATGYWNPYPAGTRSSIHDLRLTIHGLLSGFFETMVDWTTTQLRRRAAVKR